MPNNSAGEIDLELKKDEAELSRKKHELQEEG